MKYKILFVPAAFIFGACTSNLAANRRPQKSKIITTDWQIAQVKKDALETEIRLPGQLAAYQEVSIYPKVNGYVKTVLVDIGSRVAKGQLLMELEAPELLQASLEAREKYVRSLADLSIDKEHYQRLLEASKTSGAISPLDLSSARAKTTADSALCNAEKSNWEMQRTMQAYLRVTAPFDGIITERNVHPGTLVSAAGKNSPMLELKEENRLRLQVDIPENVAVNLKRKDSVSFYCSALPGKKMHAAISRESMNVNTELRSERIEMDVNNAGNRLSPGMYADVMVYARGNPNALVVPKSAVITTTEKKYILTVKNKKAYKVDVTTGNEANGKIEIYGNVAAGDRVVANPADDIRNGDLVSE
jgi:RND family efflux transporter MFP subunit